MQFSKQSKLKEERQQFLVEKIKMMESKSETFNPEVSKMVYECSFQAKYDVDHYQKIKIAKMGKEKVVNE